jgi:tetrahydromethanopterin S-methyltransferase subunit G
MSTSEVRLILERLDRQEKKIDELKSEIDSMRGGLSVLRAIGGLLGIGGLGALLTWLQSQGK